MQFVYINTRTNGYLRESRSVILTGTGDKEKLTDVFNQVLKSHKIGPVSGPVKVGFKYEVEPFTFDISANQQRK